MNRSVLTVMVILGLGPWLVSTVTAWEPDRFEAYCGKPARSSTLNITQYAFGLSDDPNTAPYYEGRLGTDPDVAAAPGCLSDVRKNLVEDYAARSLKVLEALDFASPAPNRLGPVVLDGSGQRAVRLYVDRDNDGVANTLSPCQGATVRPTRLSMMTYSPAYFDSWPNPVILRLIAHEMVHVVQNAQQLKNLPDTDDCEGIPKWLLEGTADALSVDIMRQRFPGYRPPLTVRGSKSIYGLRPYNKAFTWESDEHRDRFGHKVITDYRTSSFFMHLADHYFRGRYNYLSDFFAVPDLVSGRDDWLAWLDALLVNTTVGVSAPLYLVFPDFVSNYATWGGDKYPGIGEQQWLAESFDGCHTVALSPTRATETLTLELEPISAQCVKVLAAGMEYGELAQIKFMAYADTETEADNLHLGVARMSGRILDYPEGNLGCFEAAKRYRGRPVCINKPFTGHKGGGEAGATEQAGGGWVKTWSTVQQEFTDEILENLYLLAHTPVRPTDREHDNRGKQSVRLVVGLDRQRLTSTSHGAAAKSTAAVNHSAVEPVPMQGSEGPAGLFGGPGADALSKLPFLINAPNIPVTAMAPGEGISSVTLSNVEVKGDGDLEAGLSMTLIVEDRAIPFGATGSFPAIVSGSDQRAFAGLNEGMLNPSTAGGLEAMGMAIAAMVGQGAITNADRDQPTAAIQVVAFTDDLLHLKVSGEYCRGVDMMVPGETCQNRQQFQGEIIKPFGWTYDTAQPFVSVDTPGMELYRRHIYRVMRVDMGIALPPMPGQPDTGPGPSGPPAAPATPTAPSTSAAGILTAPQTCDCSCEGFERLKQLSEEIGQDGGASQPSSEMMAMAQCSMQCMMQWANCGK